MVKREGEKFLCTLGLRQKQARELIAAGGQGRWLLRPLPEQRGQPVALFPRGGRDE